VRRATLIVNPHSGTDRGPDLRPMIERELATIVERVDTVVTTGSDHVEQVAASAAQAGADALYVAGGDGTLNAALRGLVAAGGPPATLAIGVIPAGTGNDFAKALGLGEEPEGAVAALLRQRTLDVDVGMVNGRPFVNASAGGFVADVSEAVTEGLKDKAGKLAYLIGGARALLGSEPFAASLTGVAGRVGGSAAWSGRVRLFAVCNARFIGGGYPVAPAAAIDDGLLDVLIVPHMPVLDFVAVLQRLGAGEAQSAEQVVHFRAASFELVFDRTVRLNTDGEVLEAERCLYEVRAKAARFFCGEEPQAAG
jgi:YegS/Rv2252/BmrU family lipid kinase